MPKRRSWKVRTHDRGWQVVAAGAERATAVLARKGDAVTRAKEIARNNTPSTVVVYRSDGTIQNEVSYD